MATRLGVALLVVFPCLAQDKGPKPKELEEFRRRTATAPYQADGAPRVKATVDETVLYDGPGKNARVDVESSTRLAGQLFLSVRVEGEEVARYWIRSLAKPIKLPPTTIADPESVGYSSSAQFANGKSACKIDLTGLPGRSSPLTVYEGPGSEVAPKVLGKAPKQWYSIVVDTETVYFVPIVAPPPAVREQAGDRAKNEEKPAKSDDSKLSHEEAVSRVVARINKYRKAMGLTEVTEDKELSKGCQLHAGYIRQNPNEVDAHAHDELSQLAGYSELGKKSAARSLVSRDPESRNCERHVDGLMATFYHRLPLVDSLLQGIGIGVDVFNVDGSVVVIDCKKIEWTMEEKVRPVAFPFDGQTGVPLEFALGEGEYPDPRPNKNAPAGYPITLAFSKLGWQPGEASATLSIGGSDVECWVFCRENEALQDHKVPSAVCVLPKAPLRPNTKYSVSIRCKQLGIEKTPEWSKTWSFTTGRGNGSEK